MHQVWKIPVNSQRPRDFVFDPNNPNDFEPSKAEKARAFCFEKGWIGIGWGIEGLNRDLERHSDYLAALDVATEESLGFPPGSSKSPSTAFAARMQLGDFVWCRAAGDIYWLGRVIGPWLYKHSDEFHHFDLFQVRKCKWERVGPSDLVPGPVKNAYAGHGQTVSRILNEAALLGSALIWESKTSEIVEYNRPGEEFLLGAIGHDDLEDVVALYLQMELGWHIIPSTAKRSTPVTEFVLRNRSGKRAYLQVKSGQTRIESADIIVPKDVDEFFVFYPTIGEPTKSINSNARLKYINAVTLSKFIKENRDLVPSFVRLLLD